MAEIEDKTEQVHPDFIAWQQVWSEMGRLRLEALKKQFSFYIGEHYEND